MRGGTQFPVRLEYAKRGKIRWIGHRDVARAFERAMRVVALPLAFSEGFSPRPKVSFGLALSTGYESDAEYLDVALAQQIELDSLPASLSAALPEGIEVTGAVPLDERAPALMEAVTATEWSVEVQSTGPEPCTPGMLAACVEAALALPVLETLRRRKGREVLDDVRPVIRRLAVLEVTASGVGCEMELSTQPRSAKPGDVLAAIAAATATPGLVEGKVLRTRQWIERDGARLHPLDADTRTRPEGRETREGIDVRTHLRADVAGVVSGV